jgi:hypothetical protein
MNPDHERKGLGDVLGRIEVEPKSPAPDRFVDQIALNGYVGVIGPLRPLTPRFCWLEPNYGGRGENDPL